ncbi:hypothetical protein SLEP1_g49617 [Rubroshorea leprosula]|uniref:Uncharacterized protein n=1 Tax=Rubroshorea leprosula TaxID=152421 RepID=A0AAV5LY66_9ROSI|nr:hypothetical protein SLEP1_g49617 [Rubroshorea leprosula]
MENSIISLLKMSFGGAAMGALTTSGSGLSSIEQVKLERKSELRIEVGNDTPLRLCLLNGSAEI